ncbi:CPBP family intramembrane glutamic endopeptidase [Pseudonocardia sp. RS010]|uniref:CPBP family intramembrane glutamic endopeptidase n=1 Tax=Pseudonocardia sp. RS010 TaxID=3385979 RepID=UPI0039A0C697
MPPPAGTITQSRPRRVLPRWAGLVAAVALLVATNVLVGLVWPAWAVPWKVAVTALLLVLARACGLGRDDLGLGRRFLGRGLVYGGIAVVIIGVVYLVGIALPATRPAFEDTRAAGSAGVLLYAALVRIPFGTVLLEEVAFRSVLPGLVGGGWWRRTLVASALFGLWHVVPSLGLSSANAAVGATLGDWGDVGRAALAVVSTFAAGILLCAWRRWGGHLVTPMLAHLATNSLGVVFAWFLIS